MSLLRVVEQAIEADGGEVRVRRDRGSSYVTVYWFCGDDREFTPSDLADAINVIDKLKPHGVVLKAKDSHGNGFYVAVRDGELYADTQHELGWDGDRHVSWDDLKRALRKAM